VSEQQQALIQQGKSDIDRIREAFQNIGNTAERIVKIVHGLRSFSRDGDQDPFETVEVKSLLENTLTLCHQKFIYNQIELSVSYESPQLTVQCRSVQLSQVILNLLNNAFDAVESAPEKWIKIEVKEADRGVEIRVTDSGSGVPEQYREKIFQPFFTLKDVGKGTGLGLSISRRIMESQGGTLELDLNSSYTSFVVRVPQSRS
jgi:C4-dicarboxylate-specific signal transduction histidine kinase